MPPQILILAGPNGAGKSTLATRFVPEQVPFLNADNIARELASEGDAGRDIAAGRLLLQRLAEVERNKASFAIETNLANRTLATRIPRWQKIGFRVRLFYVWIPSADMAVARVAQRVRAGGHDIPEATIWRVYDNSEDNEAVLVARGVVKRRAAWETMLEEARQ